MTVITENLSDIAGVDDEAPIQFRVPAIRETATHDGIVTLKTYEIRPTSGVITTPSFDPGPAQVVISGKSFALTIPDSDSPVRLWPLIDAGMPTPPANATGFVRNGGGVARIQALTQAEYDALALVDPETFYVITDSSTL